MNAELLGTTRLRVTNFLMSGLLSAGSRIPSDYRFGDKQVDLKSTVNGVIEFTVGMIVFEVKHRDRVVVGVWSVGGVMVDPYAILHDLWVRLNGQSHLGTHPSGQVTAFLPTKDDLPSGFSKTSEEFSDVFDKSALESDRQ